MNKNPLLIQLLSLFVVLQLCSEASAQKKHFLYFQTEKKTSFSINIDNKVYVSSPNGYLIIPRLRNGKYFFKASFADASVAEQNFTLVIADKDQGYALKQHATLGVWELQDLQSQHALAAMSKTDWEKEKAIADTIKLTEEETIFVVAPKKTTTPVLAPSKVVIDSPKVQTTNQQEVTVTSNEPPIVVKPTPVVGFASSQQNMTTTDDGNTRVVIKKVERETGDGIDLVYVDYLPAGNDTITVFIPYGSFVNGVEVKKAPIVAPPATKKSDDPGHVDQYKRLCVYLAETPEFDKTRKAMSETTSDDQMIAVAKEAFQRHCYTVEQIKALGLLFVGEAGRVKFFTEARPFVYDLLNYPKLEEQFAKQAYKEQFRKTVQQ